MQTFDDLPLIPGAEPFLGHMRIMRRDRVAFVAEINRHVDRMSRFGSPGTKALIVNHPEVIQEYLVEKAKIFEKSFITRFSLGPLGGEGLFTSRYNESWKKQRRLMAPLFQPAQVRTYATAMVDCATKGLAHWQDGQDIELLRETTRITMAVAGKTLFDVDTLGESDAIGEALQVALDWMAMNAPSPLSVTHMLLRKALRGAGRRVFGGRDTDDSASGEPPPSERDPNRAKAREREREAVKDFLTKLGERFEQPVFVVGEHGRKLRKAIALLDEQVQRMIESHRKNPHSNDVMSRLLSARDEDGEAMSDRQVRDEVLTLFVAGHETTATALAWTVHCLVKNPDVYRDVQREVDALAGDPTYEDLPKLGLTLRVFKESMRLYPPVYLIARQCTVPTTLDGVSLARDTLALTSTYSLHRRADLWPDPERFDPDRFLPKAEAKRHRLAWLPFGAGPRVCIGNGFALMEGQLLLAKMLRHASFEPTLDEVPLGSATLRPAHNMPMRIRLRTLAS